MANKKQKKPLRNVNTTLISATIPLQNRKLEKKHLFEQFRNFGPISKFRLNGSQVWVAFETARSAAQAARAKIRTLSGHLIRMAFEKSRNTEPSTINECCNASEPMVTEDETFLQQALSAKADITDEPIIEDYELENVEGITITTSSITLHPVNKTVKKLGTDVFPALSYLQCDYDYDCNVFEEFIKCNTNLKTITLKTSDKLLPIVAKYCTKLRKLDIQLDHNLNIAKKTVRSLHIFPHLREVTLRCYQDKNITKLSEYLRACQSLEHLQVHNAFGSYQFVETLSKLPHLRYLELVDCSNLTNLNYLANMQQLKEIKVKYDKIIDSPKLNLTKLVNKCVDLSILDIDLTFDETTCNDLAKRPRDKLKMYIYKEN